MAINCLVVDDEPLAGEVIAAHIAKVDYLHLVEVCTNAIRAFEVLKKEKIDLIFLDIQMPKLTGIEFLKILNPAPKIIFTTAYRDYAIESYELNVVDYLLKPIAFDRFLMAINKVEEKKEAAIQVVQADHAEKDRPYLFLKVDRKMVKVYLDEIDYIESLKDYVRIKTSDGNELVSLQKISYLEQKLPEDCFLRIHRSYIIPLKKIEAFSAHALEIGGVELPIGRNYKSQVSKILNRDDSIVR